MKLASAMLSVLLVTAVSVGHSAQCRMSELKGLAAISDSSWATGINARGQVTGWVYRKYKQRGFLWENGKITLLGNLGVPSTRPAAINNAAHIVGSGETGMRATQAFIWRDGMITNLSPVEGFASIATAINGSDQIAGLAWQPGHIDASAATWEDGSLRYLPGLNNTDGTGRNTEATAINRDGVIVGYGPNPEGTDYLGLIWRGDTVRSLGTLGGTFSLAFGINNSGQVVGASADAAGHFHAFLWQDGMMTDINAGKLNYSEAIAINAGGEVVGDMQTRNELEREVYRAFRWKNGKWRGLGGLPGAPLTADSRALAINARGTIVGWATDKEQRMRAFIFEPGPDCPL